MKILFLGRKPYASYALEYLISKKLEVLGVVAPEEKNCHWPLLLRNKAKNYNIPTIENKDLYKKITNNRSNQSNSINIKDVDLVISYLYWCKIKEPLISGPKLGCINFHPAPLPKLRGLAGYNIAIMEEFQEYAASAHYVSETIDTGDIIEVKKFNIDPKQETAYSLEQKTQKVMFKLFKDTINTLLKNKNLPRQKQGQGKYYNKNYYQENMYILPNDTADIIDKKIRAFYYPPHQGATITLNNKEYTVINNHILKEISEKNFE